MKILEWEGQKIELVLVHNRYFDHFGEPLPVFGLVNITFEPIKLLSPNSDDTIIDHFRYYSLQLDGQYYGGRILK